MNFLKKRISGFFGICEWYEEGYLETVPTWTKTGVVWTGESRDFSKNFWEGRTWTTGTRRKERKRLEGTRDEINYQEGRDGLEIFGHTKSWTEFGGGLERDLRKEFIKIG